MDEIYLDEVSKFGTSSINISSQKCPIMKCHTILESYSWPLQDFKSQTPKNSKTQKSSLEYYNMLLWVRLFLEIPPPPPCRG